MACKGFLKTYDKVYGDEKMGLWVVRVDIFTFQGGTENLYKRPKNLGNLRLNQTVGVTSKFFMEPMDVIA